MMSPSGVIMSSELIGNLWRLTCAVSSSSLSRILRTTNIGMASSVNGEFTRLCLAASRDLGDPGALIGSSLPWDSADGAFSRIEGGARTESSEKRWCFTGGGGAANGNVSEPRRPFPLSLRFGLSRLG